MTALRHHWRLVALTAAGLVIFAVARLGWFGSGTLGDVFTRDSVEALVEQSGIFGPLLVISLMILAVVLSPVPSAPIALAAGAAYGHVWGTLYVALGAETGAMIAFALARKLGRGTLVRWFGAKIDRGMLGSQNALSVAVFASRLMPFVSFDLISYGAGLSGLRFWRFAVATFAGILPASFFLAHVGGEVITAGFGATPAIVLGLGLVTGLPLLLIVFRARGRSPKRRRNDA